MFKVFLFTLIAWWIIKRVVKVGSIVKNNGPKQPTPQRPQPKQQSPPTKLDGSKGDYVDYEEVE